MSNALPYSMSNVSVPVAPSSRTRTAPVHLAHLAPNGAAAERLAPQPRLTPIPPPIPRTLPERMVVARDRIRDAAETGVRLRSYEVALDLDLSEFHFARQFRAAFGRSPHAYYDAVRAGRARAFLREGLSEGEVARLVGFRRPAEVRFLLKKCPQAE